MKLAFMTEINKIEDVKLKKAAKAMTKDAPEYFWHIAASSTGKYHPKCDLGEGGLIRHSIMVSTVCDDLIAAEIFCRDTQVIRDTAKIAALFHDVIKQGPVDENGNHSSHTEFLHPKYAEEFVKSHLEDAKVDDLKISMICQAISTHMGKWCVGYNRKDRLSKPRTDFEKLIHTADYIASRKYIVGLENWTF